MHATIILHVGQRAMKKNKVLIQAESIMHACTLQCITNTCNSHKLPAHPQMLTSRMTVVPRRRPVRLAAISPTFWPGGAYLETVEA